MSPTAKTKHFFALLLSTQVLALVLDAFAAIVRSVFSLTTDETTHPFILVTQVLSFLLSVGRLLGLWGLRRLPGVAPSALSAIAFVVLGWIMLAAGQTVGVLLHINLFMLFAWVLLGLAGSGALAVAIARVATATKSRLSGSLLTANIVALGLYAVATTTSWAMILSMNYSSEPWAELVQATAARFSTVFGYVFGIVLIAAMTQVYLTWGQQAKDNV